MHDLMVNVFHAARHVSCPITLIIMVTSQSLGKRDGKNHLFRAPPTATAVERCSLLWDVPLLFEGPSLVVIFFSMNKVAVQQFYLFINRWRDGESLDRGRAEEALQD